GRPEQPPNRAGEAPREKEQKDERERQRCQTDTDLNVLDRPEGLQLFIAAPQRHRRSDQLIRRRANRQKVGDEGLARELERQGTDRLALPEYRLDELGAAGDRLERALAHVLHGRGGNGELGGLGRLALVGKEQN